MVAGELRGIDFVRRPQIHPQLAAVAIELHLPLGNLDRLLTGMGINLLEAGARVDSLIVPPTVEFVSANEIIAELPNLNRAELEAMDAKLHELLASSDKGQRAAAPEWGRNLAKLAGTVEGLPSDYAINHDHYLHGTPKR